MSGNLFDDEAEGQQQEYDPAQQQHDVGQEAQAQVDEQQPAAATGEANPYQQDHQQQPDQQYDQAAYQPHVEQQPGAELFDQGEEEEYKPQEVEIDHNQMAAQQQMPMGFGAERANLMGEAAMHMPTDSTSAATNELSSEPSSGEVDLSQRANNAKTELMQQILAFNTEVAQVENAGEDHKDQVEQVAQAFCVKDPVKVGKTTKYTVTGRDSNGEWSCQRRFNEFEAVARALHERWPGCYIPAIPEKVAYAIDVANMKMQDNNDAEFVEARRILLEGFIKGISHFDYLLESREFQIFARQQGEVCAQLDGLEMQRPIEILEKYRLNFSINEDQPASEMLMYKEKISTFQAFLTRSYVQIEKQVEMFRKFSVDYDMSHQHYKKIYLTMMAFEDLAVDAYSEGDRTKRVLSHPIAQELPVKITENIDKWRNPFKEAWMTLRNELLNLKAMMNAMAGRTNQEVLQTKTEAKQREKKTELEKMTLGKTTLKSFFKSKSKVTKDIDSYTAAIQQMDVDIDQFKKLVNFVTIYHGQQAIDKFKKLKAQAYYKMLNSFSIKEVSNAHLHATLSHEILQLQDQI